MPDIAENQPDDTLGFDPRIQTEDIAFKPDDLVTCGACKRMNPPNRIKCLYCANQLEVEPENVSLIKPNLRKLEEWERGFNVILIERMTEDKAFLAKAAALLSLDADTLAMVIDANEPLPLARVESSREADILVARLGRLGLACRVVADADLADDKLPVRLSGMEFRDRCICVTDFNTQKLTEIGVDDLALLIPGIITTSKVDALEKKSRGGKSKVIDETATASDESILDIYSRHDPVGFRVHLTGFDFSCLGDDKGLIAVENLRRLVVVLKERAPNTRLVADYRRVRAALGQVWEIESRKDPKGIQPSGFGKREFGTVASTRNLRQFTKYSRLQWHLL